MYVIDIPGFRIPITFESDRQLKKYYSPLKPPHLKACLAWLDQMERAIKDGKRKPSPSLLIKGLPHGSLRNSRIVLLNGEKYVAFRVADRTERLVDPATFCCMRLMTLPGKDCEWWFDRSTKKKLPEERQRYYPRFTRGLGLWGFRIFADAKPGEVIRQRNLQRVDDHWGFRDLRMINFFRTTRQSEQQRGKAMRATYKGRALAIEACLKNFGSGVSGLSLSRAEYESLLARAFALLDQLHAHQVEDRRKQK